ncbi:MAG: sensor histidine kinase [Acidobacteria bacterium]|nr:sensor histidine kinase [Acidobacteriota bacterium]
MTPHHPSLLWLSGRDLLRGVAVFGTIAAISSLHYVTVPSRVVLHEIYNYSCYVPIILGAYWWGVWGGIASAALTSAAFIPHIRAAWAANAAYTASQYAQVVVFHLLGVTVGLLAGSQRRLTARYRGAAASLEHANRELRESQEHLRRADRLSALGEIAAGLAHEIQNPLAGVKGALEIVSSRVPKGSPEAEFADIGGKELARLETLVREFLTYARPHEPALRTTDAYELVERVAALLRPEADKKEVTLVLDRADGAPPLALDPEQMTQVIFNIVLNAIQASPPGRPVHVRESIEPGWSTIEVLDEGPGIAPEHMSRIFDPFFTTKSRGTGLGLAISHRIVTAHGGTISAVPRSPSGTILRVRLPRSTDQPAKGSPLTS